MLQNKKLSFVSLNIPRSRYRKNKNGLLPDGENSLRIPVTVLTEYRTGM